MFYLEQSARPAQSEIIVKIGAERLTKIETRLRSGYQQFDAIFVLFAKLIEQGFGGIDAE